jgi:hypothetical protein
MCP